MAIKELLAEDSESGIDENTFSEEKNSECDKSEGIGKEEVTENIVEKMESDSEREKKRDGEISTDSEEQQKTGVTGDNAADSGAECEMKSGTRESPVTEDTSGSDKVSYAVVTESEAESDQKMDTQSLDLQASGGSSIQKDYGDGKEELQCSRSSEIEINKSTESPVTDDKSDKGSDAFVMDSPRAVKGESGSEVAKCLSDLSIKYSKVDIKDLPSLSEDTDMGDLTPYAESEAESDQKMDTQSVDSQTSGGSSVQKDAGELQCSRSSEIERNESTESPVTDDKSDKGSYAFVTESKAESDQKMDTQLPLESVDAQTSDGSSVQKDAGELQCSRSSEIERNKSAESPVTDDKSDKGSYAFVTESKTESDQKMDTQLHLESVDAQTSDGSSIQKDTGELQCSRSSEIERNKSTESPVTDDKSDKGSYAFVTESKAESDQKMDTQLPLESLDAQTSDGSSIQKDTGELKEELKTHSVFTSMTRLAQPENESQLSDSLEIDCETISITTSKESGIDSSVSVISKTDSNLTSDVSSWKDTDTDSTTELIRGSKHKKPSSDGSRSDTTSSPLLRKRRRTFKAPSTESCKEDKATGDSGVETDKPHKLQGKRSKH